MGVEGNLLVVDTGNNRVRRINLEGTFTALAGSGTMGFKGDGGPAAEEAPMWPQSVAAHAVGDIRHFRIRKIDSKRIIRTIAGTGKPGYSGDGGPAT